MAARRIVALGSLAAVLAASGIGVGVYLAVRGDGGGSNEHTVRATNTSTVTATRTAAAATPTSTESPATPTEPPTLAPTPDTRVAIRDLPTADQIQLGPDGKYFLPDRGDGCRWVEHARVPLPDFGEAIVLSTDCPADFGITFRPATGEVAMLVS